jgi:DNA-binding NtrC family response regulator
VFLDIKMPGLDGLEVLSRLRGTNEALPVVIVSAHGSTTTALEAGRLGAFRFIEKPLSKDYVLDAVREGVELGSLRRENRTLRTALETRQQMVGESAPLKTIMEQVRRAAPTNATVLILGESGVGKELIARAIHKASLRSRERFVQVNCAAIPEELIESELFGHERGAFTGATEKQTGKFEQADRGTIFLDEVGDMSPKTQAKVLRVLQEGEVERLGDHKTRKIDVRLVAATNIDLRTLVKEGKFRSDLYYRLNAFQINIPPLRERKEDVLLLASHFMEKYSAVRGKKLRGFTDKAKRALLAYPWPGNVRELQNMVERGVILAPSGSRIEVDQVFSSYSGEHAVEFGLDSTGGLGIDRPENGEDFCEAVLSGALTLEQSEAMIIKAAVDRARGNLSAAARMLGLTRPQLAYRLGRLHENAPAQSGATLTSTDDPSPARHGP